MASAARRQILGGDGTHKLTTAAARRAQGSSLKEAKGGSLDEFSWKSIPKFWPRAFYWKLHDFCTSG